MPAPETSQVECLHESDIEGGKCKAIRKFKKYSNKNKESTGICNQ